MAQSEQGFFDVKFNRIKYAYTNKELLIKTVAEIINKKVTTMLYDINPITDLGALIFFYE